MFREIVRETLPGPPPVGASRLSEPAARRRPPRHGDAAPFPGRRSYAQPVRPADVAPRGAGALRAGCYMLPAEIPVTTATSPDTGQCPCEEPVGEAQPARWARRVHVVGPVCFDLVFSGLPTPPRPGTEVRAASMGISPGGVANVAVALARLGLDVALSAVFAEDAFGHYLWGALSDEGIDMTYSVQVGGWSTPVTSSVAIAGEREMVTYEEVPPVALETLVPPGYQADAFVVSLADADPEWLAGLHRFAPLVFADVAWDDERLGSSGLVDALAAIDVFMPNAAEALACAH